MKSLMKQLILIFIFFSVLLAIMQQAPGCLKVRLPYALSLYSESQNATNIVASFTAGDQLYICGEDR